MGRKASPFTTDSKLQQLIVNRLGWVDSPGTMYTRLGEIEQFGQAVIEDGIRHVVVLGMGGSSLFPETLGRMFGKRPEFRSFGILDSTSPAAVEQTLAAVELSKTLFIVASKSGGTIETRSHEAFFYDRVEQSGIQNPGQHFAVITDPGSELEASARRNSYRAIFLNPPDVGGRYSALTYFGLVPAWFAGVDLPAFLKPAVKMQEILSTRFDESNPALALGALMAVAAQRGRNKLTFVADRKLAPVVPWLEQLIAESTGKDGKGVIPIEGEPTVDLTEYSNDRLFVFLTAGSKVSQPHEFKRGVEEKGLPYLHTHLGSMQNLSAHLLVWELATAVCGWVLKVNPFDEPNVTESKEATLQVLQSGDLNLMSVIKTATRGKAIVIQGENASDVSYTQLKSALSKARIGDYVALLIYDVSSKALEAKVTLFRQELLRLTKLATLRGYGPRYLHSIGQLYKGGPRTGLFIVISRNDYDKLPIPFRPFGFDTLITAQALGDIQSLLRRKKTVLIMTTNHPQRTLQNMTNLISKIPRKRTR